MGTSTIAKRASRDPRSPCLVSGCAGTWAQGMERVSIAMGRVDAVPSGAVPGGVACWSGPSQLVT
jgi:hypothetical protein